MKKISKKELYAIFVEAIIKYSEEELEKSYKSVVVEEKEVVHENGDITYEEVAIGTMRIIYVYLNPEHYDQDNLAYNVMLVGNTLSVIQYWGDKPILKTKYNPKNNTWKAVPEIEYSGSKLTSDEIIKQVVEKLYKIM